MSATSTTSRVVVTRKIRRKRPSVRTPLAESLEHEARRIAQTLHDEAGQMLAAVHIRLDELGQDLPNRYHPSLEEIKSMLNRVEDELRNLAHELRPSILDHLGLMPAIEFLADSVAKRTGLIVTLEGSTGGRLPANVETTLYRVVQEALTNSSKHARATRVRIRLWRRGQ